MGGTSQQRGVSEVEFPQGDRMGGTRLEGVEGGRRERGESGLSVGGYHQMFP